MQLGSFFVVPVAELSAEVERLEAIWNEVGLPEADRRTQCAELQAAMLGALRVKVNEQRARKSSIQQQITSTRERIAKLRALLGPDLVSPDAGTSTNAPGTADAAAAAADAAATTTTTTTTTPADATASDAPTDECLALYAASLVDTLRNFEAREKELLREKQQRTRRMGEMRSELQALWARFGGPFGVHGEEAARESADISSARVALVTANIAECKTELQRRTDESRTLTEQIGELRTLLGQTAATDATAAATNSAGRDAAATAPIDVTDRALAALRMDAEWLALERGNREQHVRSMAREIAPLWELLGVAPAERALFLQRHSDLSDATLQAVAAELERLRSVKRERMNSMIEERADCIRELWSQTEAGTEAPLPSLYLDGVRSEHVLDELAAALQRVTGMHGDAAPIVKLIQRRAELLAEKSEYREITADSNRLMQRGKDAMTNLKREQELRVHVEKTLPKLEAKLCEALAQWLDKYGDKFHYQGADVLASIQGEMLDDVREREQQRQRVLMRRAKTAHELEGVTDAAAVSGPPAAGAAATTGHSTAREHAHPPLGGAHAHAPSHTGAAQRPHTAMPHTTSANRRHTFCAPSPTAQRSGAALAGAVAAAATEEGPVATAAASLSAAIAAAKEAKATAAAAAAAGGTSEHAPQQAARRTRSSVRPVSAAGTDTTVAAPAPAPAPAPAAAATPRRATLAAVGGTTPRQQPRTAVAPAGSAATDAHLPPTTRRRKTGTAPGVAAAAAAAAATTAAATGASVATPAAGSVDGPVVRTPLSTGLATPRRQPSGGNRAAALAASLTAQRELFGANAASARRHSLTLSVADIENDAQSNAVDAAVLATPASTACAAADAAPTPTPTTSSRPLVPKLQLPPFTPKAD